jgi:hypothetical protein
MTRHNTNNGLLRLFVLLLSTTQAAAVSWPGKARADSSSESESSARSSTASHYSKGFGSAGAGTAATEFYGIPLGWPEPSLEILVALFLLLAAIILKPRFAILKRPSLSAAFWVAALTVTYVLREVTLFPLITTIIYTRTSYPYLIVIPHCIDAAATYRRERSTRSSAEVHYLASFGLAFFCYGFGGSIVSDGLMGLPITAMGHPRIFPCYLLGWLLVWWSLFDIVYRSYSDPQSFFHFFLTACEAVDAVTTPMGRVSRAARELKNKLVAPVLAGLFAGVGGAAIRYGERVVLQGASKEANASFASLEAGVWRTLGYSLLWWWLAVQRCDSGLLEGVDADDNHCHDYNGHNLARVLIVVLHVLWTLACDVGLAGGHPFVWATKKLLLGNVGAPIARFFRLGPQPAESSNGEQVKAEKTD